MMSINESAWMVHVSPDVLFPVVTPNVPAAENVTKPSKYRRMELDAANAGDGMDAPPPEPIFVATPTPLDTPELESAK
jgi:hypothetical protein